MKPVAVIIAACGQGRSLSNFLKYQDKWQQFKISGLISSKLHCGAIEIANTHGIPVYKDTISQNQTAHPALEEWLIKQGAEWIALAGFIKKFPTLFPKNPCLRQRIINIHPSLLPLFSGQGMYGHHVHQAVYEAKLKETGATVHYVNEHYDEGAIISQIKVPIEPFDSIDIISRNVFRAECLLYPHTLSLLIQGTLPLANNKIYNCKEMENL